MFSVKFLIFFLAIFGYAFTARPKPAYDCDDDKPDPRYLNQACESDNQCFGRHMSCKEGKCQCKEETVPQERFVGEKAKQMVCEGAPGLNDKCETICLKPLTCGDSPTGKVCLCTAPYKIVDNECILECKEDERYDRASYACLKRCRANEVEIEDKCLAAVAEIGGACQNDKQCSVGYSNCKDGRCSCLEGFNNANGQCVPQKINCPSGATSLMNGTQPVPCKVDRDPAPGAKSDNCPAGNVCFIPSSRYGEANGFCCSEVPSTICPLGVPDARYTCSPNHTCPYNSHFCYSHGNAQGPACCPEMCSSSNDKYIDGKCYQSRALKDFCTRSEQCPTWSECKQGRCECRPGTTAKGNQWHTYCNIECKQNEVYNKEKCYTRLGLGERCEGEEWRCPASAFCNKHKVCACRCPYFTLAKDLCAPLPRCPGLKRPRSYMARSGLGADMETAVKGYEPISEVDRQKVLENITFCSAGSAEGAPKVEAVADCEGNKYCARYINNLGMCCKKIETVCPDGHTPAVRKTCNPFDITACPAGQYCYDYLYKADPKSQVGTMCCPTGINAEGEDD